MFDAISGATSYPLSQHEPASNSSLPLCRLDIPDQMVTGAIDAIISRMALAYLELMREAKERPEIISDYKSSLYDYYKDQSLTPEIQSNVMEAQNMAPNCSVITKTLSPERRISVLSEKNSEFDENPDLDKARLQIRLRIKAKNIKEEDPLDHLLSQLSKKLFSLGYGDEGTFDIRLEKGCLSLVGNDRRWHFDGEAFKTSITVCFSSQKNWSTRVFDSKTQCGRPADHGCLYDALNVYHRAPIPSDLEGKELNADDYRLFIRYNEFFTLDERPYFNRNAAKNSVELEKSRLSEDERPSFNEAINQIQQAIGKDAVSNNTSMGKRTEFEHLLRGMSTAKEQAAAISNLLGTQHANHLVDSSVTRELLVNKSLWTGPPLDLTAFKAPSYNFSESLVKIGSDRPIIPKIEHASPPEQNKRSQCTVM